MRTARVRISVSSTMIDLYAREGGTNGAALIGVIEEKLIDTVDFLSRIVAMCFHKWAASCKYILIYHLYTAD